MLLLFACAIFPALLIFAAFHDVATMTIPNWVSIGLALAFLPAAALAGLTLQETGMHLAMGALALAVGAGLFFIRVWGGGDAKLVAAAALWIGWAAGMEFLFGMAVAGGALAVILVVARRLKLQSDTAWLSRLLSPKEGAPYGVAIAFGGIWAASSSDILSPALRAAGVGN